MDWIILGTGDVARKFAIDVVAAGHRVTGVASRDPGNARAFAASLGLQAETGDYGTVLGGPGRAVYIATPPAQHEAHALSAIAAGKAVLIEKPMAPDAATAGRIAQAARAAGVFAMEAMWTRFQPLVQAVRARVGAGALGELRGFDARFLLPNRPDPAASLFDPDRGGGALLHRGIYGLSLARHLLGPVEELVSLARLGGTGVDEDSALVLRHGSGAITTLRASLRTAGPEASTLFGTAGTLTLEGPVYRPTGARLVPVHPMAATGGGGPRRLEAFRESGLGLRLSGRLSRLRAARKARRLAAPFAGNGYRHQALAVAEALSRGETEHALMPLDESIEILALVDRARDNWTGGDRP